MLRIPFMSALLALVAGSAFAALPGASDLRVVRDSAPKVQVAQCSRYGPYATVRRANEVAAEARSYGYTAVVYPEWGAYYVNVC